jgi:hypothetical protein
MEQQRHLIKSSLIPAGHKAKIPEITFFFFPINFLKSDYKPISSHWLIDALGYWLYFNAAPHKLTTDSEINNFVDSLDKTLPLEYRSKLFNEVSVVFKNAESKLLYIKDEKKKTLVRGFWVTTFILFITEYYKNKMEAHDISELDHQMRIIASVYSMLQMKNDSVNILDCKPAYRYITCTHNMIIRRMWGYVKIADGNICPDIDSKYLFDSKMRRNYYVRVLFPKLLNELFAYLGISFVNRFPVIIKQGAKIKKTKMYSYSRILTSDELKTLFETKKINSVTVV